MLKAITYCYKLPYLINLIFILKHNIAQVRPAFGSVGSLYARVEITGKWKTIFYVDSREIHQKCKYFPQKMFLFSDVSCI